MRISCNKIKTLPYNSLLLVIILTTVFMANCVSGNTSQQYSGSINLTSISPAVKLHSLNGKKWNSFSFLGKKPVILILIGQSPQIESKNTDQKVIITSIAHAIKKLKVSGFEAVTVARNKFIPKKVVGKTSQFQKIANRLNLHYDNGLIYSLFGASNRAITFVGIDKSGFLRREEKLPISNEIGNAIIDAATFAIPLRVGEQAPDFSIDLGQSKWRLANFRGWKRILILFMPDVITCDCQNPLPFLEEKKPILDRADIEVLIISSDLQNSAKLNNSSAVRMGFFTDNDRNLHYLFYDTKKQPPLDALAVLVDEDGTIKYIAKGDDPVILSSSVMHKITELYLSGGRSSENK